MDKSKSRKKSPVFLFLAVFAAILVIMFIANMRSDLAEEIRFPFNNGVARLSTYRNYLTVVSHGQKMYIWDWQDLSKKSETCSVGSSEAVLLASDYVISVSPPHRAVVVTNLRVNKPQREIPLPSNTGAAHLGVNRDRSRIVVLITESDDKRTEQVSYVLLHLDFDAGRVEPILRIGPGRGRLRSVSVSDDGRYVTAVGEKDNHSWIILADTTQGQVVWEKEIPTMEKFYKAVFSTNGDVLYARGSDSTLHTIETISGKVLERLLPIEENRSTYRAQPTQTVSASPDGRLVAATVLGTVYVWDCRSYKLIFSVTPPHKLISSMAFSADSRFLATSDSRQGGTIKIWRIPQH